MSYFYSKYIVIEDLITELHGLDLSDEERHHLASLIDSQLHHAILDEILSNLTEADKKVFINKIKEDPESEDILDFLNEKIENIEGKISKVSDQLVKELHGDVKEAKKVSSR